MKFEEQQLDLAFLGIEIEVDFAALGQNKCLKC